MKLRNKKTGEIVDLIEGFIVDTRCGEKKMIKPVAISNNVYTSLAELNEEWEDYEEPKVYWYIMGKDDIRFTEDEGTDFDNKHKGIGNYFETEEEAEKALEKLMAWKRLKDKGFRFIGKTYETDKRFGSTFYKVDDGTYSEDIVDDLDLLFSGGEE